MVVVGMFTANVFLNDVKAEEFPPTSRLQPKPDSSFPFNNPLSADAFVETDYFVENLSYPRETIEEDPYGEEIKQNYNVTPYTLKVSNNSLNEVAVTVLIDGTEIHRSCLSASKRITVKGAQEKPGHYDSALRELLWSRPKSVMQKNEDRDVVLPPEQLFNLGSIRVLFYAVKRWEEKVYEGPTDAEERSDENRGGNRIETTSKVREWSAEDRAPSFFKRVLPLTLPLSPSLPLSLSPHSPLQTVAKAKKVTGCSETGRVIASTVKSGSTSTAGSAGGYVTKNYYKPLIEEGAVQEICIRYR